MAKLKFRFVQLSDLHLLENEEDWLGSVCPFTSLTKIVQKVKTLEPFPDFLLLSGDMTHKGAENGYRILNKALQTLQIPYYWLEGNHDDKATMYQLEPALSVNPSRSFEHQGVSFILLDSVSDDKPHGEFSEQTLQFLQETLEKSQTTPCVLAFHHHIVATSCAWLDRSMVQNTEAFWKVVSPYSHIQMILHGHIHHAGFREVQGLSIFSAPSTAFQFDLTQETYEKPAAVSAGFRIIDIDEENHFQTEIERL